MWNTQNNNNCIGRGHPVNNGDIPSVGTGWDKFVEFLNLLFEFCTVVISIPLVLVQEVISCWRNWRGINPSKLESLKGKVVLITGANSGIGECLAKYFYLAGCQLILAARRKNELERVRDSLVAMPSATKTFVPAVLELDLSDRKSIPEKADLAILLRGGIDILVNNAGIFNRGMVLDTVMEVDEQIMAVNYLGTLALTKFIARHMVEQKRGHICFVSSVLGKMSISNSLSYSASKHAMQALADSLRVEIESKGVNITIISPSYVNTDITKNALTSNGTKYGKVTKEIETGYSPEYVSERIFKAVVNQEKDLTIAPLEHRAAIYARNFLPAVFFMLVKRRRFD